MKGKILSLLMFVLLLLVLYRVSGRVSFAYFRAVLSSFGFYKGAEITVRLTPVSPAVVNRSLVIHWFKPSTVPLDLYFGADFGLFECDEFDSKMSFNVTLMEPEVVLQHTVEEKGVLIPIIVHCGHDPARLKYDAEFVYHNVKTQLDYREWPNIITFPIICALSGVLLIVWIVLNCCRQRKFKGLNYAITAILVLYIISAITSCIWYRVADKTDDYDAWSYVSIVLSYFYWACLLTFIVVAATGWGTMNSELTLCKLIVTIVCCILTVACFWIMSYATNLGLWMLIPVILGFTCAVLLARELIRNTQEAMMHVRAHMMVIYRSGIDAKTTPVYLKYTTYRQFMIVLGAAIAATLVLFAALIWLGVDDWVNRLFFNLSQVITLACITFVFRPRGEKIDRYLRQDRTDPGDRESIALEDLNGFDMNAESQETAPWDGESRLPLEPVLISSAPSRRSFGRNAELDATYTQPLNPNQE